MNKTILFLGLIISIIFSAFSLSLEKKPNEIKYLNSKTEDGINDTYFKEMRLDSFPLNDDCSNAIELPLNTNPCGRMTRIVYLNGSTNSTPPPSSECSNTYAGKDVWFSVQVPYSGNFLIRQDSLTKINPVLEAYTGGCDALTPIKCHPIDSVPYVLTFENLTPNSFVYIRIWDKNNTIVNTVLGATLEVSAHMLSYDKRAWELCDYPIARSADNVGAGNKCANEIVIQYSSDATEEDIDTISNELIRQGAVLLKECPCGGGKAPLQLWIADNPIELEQRIRRAVRRAKVDTSNYNFIMETREFKVSNYVREYSDLPAVTVDDDGNFVMAWAEVLFGYSHSTIKGQLYNKFGNPLSPEFIIDSVRGGPAYNKVKLASDRKGNFTVLWEEGPFSYIKLYNKNGSVKKQKFSITLGLDPSATRSRDIAMDQYGNFVIIGQHGRSNKVSTIYAQRFTPDGNPLGVVFQVFRDSVDIRSPSVTMNKNGDFIVAWSYYSEPNTQSGIKLQRFDKNANIAGHIIDFPPIPLELKRQPDVALNNDGKFIVSWISSFNATPDSTHLQGQLFDALGYKIGQEFQIPISSNWSDNKLLFYENGEFVTFYSTISDTTGSLINRKLLGQIFNSEGSKSGNPFLVGLTNFTDAAIAKNKLGQFLVAWSRYDGLNPGSQIFAQRYQSFSINRSTLIIPTYNTIYPQELGEPLLYPRIAYSPTSPKDTVLVAIIDTGVDPDHVLIQEALWKGQSQSDSSSCIPNGQFGYDFANNDGLPEDNKNHGTAINGMITRDFPNDIQLELINLKFYDNGTSTLFDAVCAIYTAVEAGANILNLSWGFESIEFPSILFDALQYASEQDVLIIASAGNLSKNNDLINKYPANLDIPSMVVVGSYQLDEVNQQPILSEYSNYGAINVDLLAPGFVESTIRGNTLSYQIGTSMAAPLVARTAAILKARNPNLSAVEIKNCILNSARYVPGLEGKVLTSGILDAEAALECMIIRTKETQLTIDTKVEYFPNPTSNILHCIISTPKTEIFTLKLINAHGQIVHSQKTIIQAGRHQIELGLQALPSGIYYSLLGTEQYMLPVKSIIKI